MAHAPEYWLILCWTDGSDSPERRLLRRGTCNYPHFVNCVGLTPMVSSIEIKKHLDPDKKDIPAFRILDRIPGTDRGQGGVVCMYDNLITLKDEDKIIPVKYL